MFKASKSALLGQIFLFFHTEEMAMEYRAVGNRCAVTLNALDVPLSREAILSVLQQKGFTPINVDLIALARQCITTSRYRRGARLSEAPAIVDCSSFVKWLYAQRGIWLPRRSIQQRDCGEAIELEYLVAGDVLFVSGWIDYYHYDPRNGVGHVGIATGESTVIHAANSRANVVESPVLEFVGETKFRGARRYIPKGVEVVTFETPVEREIETADDVRWVILQSLS